MVSISKYYEAEVVCKKSVIIQLNHINQTRIKNINSTFRLVDRGAGGTIFLIRMYQIKLILLKVWNMGQIMIFLIN